MVGCKQEHSIVGEAPGNGHWEMKLRGEVAVFGGEGGRKGVRIRLAAAAKVTDREGKEGKANLLYQCDGH